jgi:hypothetical protein
MQFIEARDSLMLTLNINETSPPIVVNPRDRFFPSGIEITPGAQYQFQAEGKWKDAWIVCGAEGWRSVLTGLNRLPGQPIFSLCGTVGKNLDHVFHIGKDCDWGLSAEFVGLPDRQLYCFANDWPFMYWNNISLSAKEGGPLCVTIKRLS